jgi:ribose 5-phosphate isomerase B
VQVARAVADHEADFGLLVCGTGIGMAITANKIAGVRAASVSDTFSAHASREHNDANVLCIGERVVGLGLAKDILDAFLGAQFQGGRHWAASPRSTRSIERESAPAANAQAAESVTTSKKIAGQRAQGPRHKGSTSARR